MACPHTDDLADRLKELQNWHLGRCGEMHGLDGMDTRGPDCCFHSGAAWDIDAELRRDAALTTLLDAVGDALAQAESVSGECGELVAHLCGPLATAFAAPVEGIDR